MEINGYEIETGANLRGADLCGANLYGADLSRAILSGANLYGADLYGANLYGANLYGADLSRAILCGAVLREADLYGANLYGANLYGADLSRAILCGAVLREADLCGANLPAFQICPEVGSFIAWKKVQGSVLKIEIPARAKRTSSLTGRKCRAEFVVTLEGAPEPVVSRNACVYFNGQPTSADSFDPDPREVCTNGIHFFMTREEAERW